jgi:hypothetical protein
MTNDERKKRLAELEEEKKIYLAEQDLRNLKSNSSRARAVTVGTAFGGVTEISLRGEAGDFLWCLLQPVEVTELIHQLAGNIGCHIAIQPRNDFASWRAWKTDDAGMPLLSSHAPHPNDLSLSHDVGAAAENTVESIGLKDLETISKIRNKDEHTVAVKKVINKRKSKRAPAAT